jgi:alkylhydroperoxidase/carboxymuconolactone decarboxylase family protein YurZ
MGDRVVERSSTGDLRARIALVDAAFERGLASLEAAIRTDGALPARDKAVLVVAATSVRDRDATGAEVARSLSLGAHPDDLRALALALYLSRGAAPCRAVLDAVDDLDPPAEVAVSIDPVSIDPVPIDPVPIEVVLAEFASVFGEVPERVLLLRDHSHAGLDAYHRMRTAVLRSGRLDPLLAELALVCVNAAEHRSDFAAVHVRGARRAGASEPQLVEAGLCAIPSGGVAAWLAASEAIVSSRDPAEPEPPR